MDTTLEPIRVMYVRAASAPVGVQRAFDELESKLSTMKGRRFYGTFDMKTKEYRACVEQVEGDDPVSLGLATCTIPGGRYVRQKVDDWGSKLHQIPQLFEGMAQGRRADPSRPSLEFYRSRSELVLYLPVAD